MKRLLIFFLLAQSAYGVAVVQFNKGSAGSASSLSVAYPSNVGAGHLLVAVAASNGTPFTLSSSNNTWTAAKHTSFGLNYDISYVCNSVAGADTVTIGTAAASIWMLKIYEISGILTSSCIDINDGGSNQSAGTTYTITSSTSVAQGTEIVMAFAVPNNASGSNPTITLSGSYVIIDTAAVVTSPQFSQLTDSQNSNYTGLSGTQSVTFTANAAPGFWTGSIISFKGVTTPASSSVNPLVISRRYHENQGYRNPAAHPHPDGY